MKPTTNKRTIRNRIRRTLADAIEACRKDNPRSREWILDVFDAVWAANDRRVKAALRQWTPGTDTITLTLHGGFVANSYKYRAEGDEARVIIAPDGTVKATCERGWAQSRSRGRGDHLVVRLVEPHHTQGRVIQ